MINLEDASTLAVTRKIIEINDFGRFKIGAKNYGNEFCRIYRARLEALTNTLVEASKIKWGQYQILTSEKISLFNEGETVIIIGTLYKHQELERSILKELCEEIEGSSSAGSKSDARSIDKDKLFIENEILRAALTGQHPNPGDVVTGLVCAVLGYQTDNGSFWVEDWFFPGCCPQANDLRLLQRSRGKILLVSGFDFAHTPDRLSFDLLSEWVRGLVGIPDPEDAQGSLLLTIIAGNSVSSSLETYTREEKEREKSKGKRDVSVDSILATRRFDRYLSGLLENCPVILMPGEFDPSEHSVPQQALHPCILEKSSRYKTLRGVTNPWIGKIGERIVCGSSGQPIADAMRVGRLEEATALDWLERTLRWRHLAPTAPNTLAAYPYFAADPFVLTECPDIYFAGNMHNFATRLYTGEEGQIVRLVCIPEFAKTATAVLVDLETLDASPISFGSA